MKSTFEPHYELIPEWEFYASAAETEYLRSICIAVENGFDTDCNAATVGSILGMRGGTACIDEVWTAPFHDTLRTTLCGVPFAKISDLAAKTMTHLP